MVIEKSRINYQDEDEEENTISNVKVQLLKEDGSIYKTTQTDQDGNYTFNVIEEGRYKLQIVCGKIEDDELNTLDIETIKNVLKYNGQDFMMFYDDSEVFNENEERNEAINTYFSEFNYDNTSIFEILNDDVSTVNEEFKEKAKTLSDEAHMIYDLTYLIDVSNSDSNKKIDIPTLYLIERDGYEISTNSFITGMELTLNNGTVLSNTSTSIGEHEDLIYAIQKDQIHGTSVRLEYTVYFKNTSSYTSCSNLGFLVYLPKNFEYREDYGISATTFGQNSEQNEINDMASVETINVDNLDDFEYSEIISQELIDFLNNQKRNVLYIQLDIDNDEFDFGFDEMIRLKFSISTLLSGNDDEMGYYCKTEIAKYSHNSNRRLLYTNREHLTAIAGNNDSDNEGDFRKSENCAIIVLPTGKLKVNFKIIIFIIFIIVTIVLFIKVKR